ncbi:MAG TPA: hypothetical protein VJ576_18150 [Rhodocyclaceae bacterium]|nr:hypothetical protein [Rhodocyclaceae bacterium]
MTKIIREKYESGVLVSREIEDQGSDAIKVAKLCVQVIIAISVAVIAVITVRDSLNYSLMADPSDMVGTSVCPAPPTFRS